MAERIREWHDSPHHDASSCIPGSEDAIEELAEEHELHIITSRPEVRRAQTAAWLERHFPGRFAGMHFVGPSDGKHGSKVAVCKDLGISFLVDDALANARAVAEAGIPVLLLDAPWNQEPVEPPVIRVAGWDEAVARIRAMTHPHA
jgi:uncharacterized HAD superfamily protein